MTKYTNKGKYHPFAPTLTSFHWNQMFAESVDLIVCVAMVFRGENKDWIGPWMTFCELPTITVGMNFYMHSLLFRYLHRNQSWMMQVAEVYDIQIDLNSKLLWLFRFTNSFPAYHCFLQIHSLSKLNSLIKVWTCLIFPTFSYITELPLKSHSISKTLTLLLFVINTKSYKKYHLQLQPSHFWSGCSEFYWIYLDLLLSIGRDGQLHTSL